MNDTGLMLNGTIEKMSEEERSSLLVRFAIYIAEGSLLIIVNFVMFFAIVRHSTLRAQYTVLCGLLFTDGLMGFATISAGIGRTEILLSNTQVVCICIHDSLYERNKIDFVRTTSYRDARVCSSLGICCSSGLIR